MRTRAKLSLVAAAVAFTAVVGVPALALGRANPHANAQAAEAVNNTERPADSNSQAIEHKAAASAKLTEAKLRTCENRQKAITNIMARIAGRGQKQLTLFSTIASRVETFYTTKDKTLDNYNSLVADVSTKQTAAQAAVDSIKSASTGFSCEGNDPRGFVGSFKDSLKSEISALQDYRTSVKNLTVGVRSVQGSTVSATNQNGGGNQ